MHIARKFGRALAVATILGGAMVGIQVGAAAATGAPSAPPVWKTVGTPNQPHASSDLLNGISCASIADCMAVGDYEVSAAAGTALLIERWNGVRWSLLRAPSIGLPAVLTQVSCPNKAFCVAVGYFVAGSKDQPLAASWNGHAWSQLNFPSVAGADEGKLTGVDCFSGTDCVVVGWTNDASDDSNLIARFNGTAWRMGTIKNGAGIVDPSLVAVSCSTRTWCVAVGGGGHGEYGDAVGIALTSVNQMTWTYTDDMKLPAAESGFYGVSCTGKNTCVAFGWGAPVLNKDYKWVMETGTGNAWREYQAPWPATFPFESLQSIACSTGRQCTLVGELLSGLSSTSKYTSLIMTWNGHKLLRVPAPAVHGFPYSYLGGVTCSGTACWAVGEVGTAKITRTLADRS